MMGSISTLLFEKKKLSSSSPCAFCDQCDPAVKHNGTERQWAKLGTFRGIRVNQAAERNRIAT